MEVKGFNKLQKHLNDLQRGIDRHVFANWTDTIEQTAKQICNDTDCKRIKFIHTQEFGFKFEVADKEALDCIIRAIQNHENSTSFIIKEMSEILINELEDKKRKNLIHNKR